MTYEFWFMLPVAILFSTIAMSSGVEGATFFTPLFILALGISPEIAVGTGLITEVFGFASGLVAYSRKKLIDFKLGMSLLVVAVPMGVFGTWLAGYIPADILKTVLGMGLIAIALTFLRAPEKGEVDQMNLSIEESYGGENARTCLVTNQGEEICYTACNRTEGRVFAGLGGVFIGMISTGLGELNGYYLLQRCKIPSAVAVATSVFVVAITALIASIGHFIKFVQTGGETLNTVLSLIIFTVPGVLVGGQIGAWVASRISQNTLEKGLATLFLIVAVLMLGGVIFG